MGIFLANALIGSCSVELLPVGAEPRLEWETFLMTVLSTVLRRSYMALALLCLALPSLAMAQAQAQAQPAQEEDLSADEIIEILQQNPDLLADAKAEIIAQLRDRGYPVNERTITDDRLFSEIRSDDRARHVMSDALKKRGFGSDQSVESQAQPQPPTLFPAPGTGAPARPATGTQPAANAATSATVPA